MLRETLCLLRDRRLIIQHLLPCTTKKEEQSQKEESASEGSGSPVLWRVKGERRNDHSDSLLTPEVSELPSEQWRVRRLFRHKDDAPYSSRISA